MIRFVANARTHDGFPLLRWEQDIPTGESAHTVEQMLTLKIVAVLMIFVFVAVYSGSGDFWAGALAALIAASFGLAGDKLFKGGIKVWDVHIPGPELRPGAEQLAAEREQRARATAMLATEQCAAMAFPDSKSGELLFSVLRGPTADKMEAVGTVPLASLQAFELGTAEEWFMDVAQAQARRVNSAPNSFVIVAPTLGHGVLPVAESGGTRANIAALHGLLLKEFVIAAPEMLDRWKEALEERKRSASGGG
jgi:hypothetical protein